MSTARVQPTQSRRNVVGASSVAGASLWSALVSYLVMAMAAWALSKDDATLLLTFLAVLFATYGVMSGVALEVTRSVAAAARDNRADGPPLWQVAAVVSSVGVLAVLAVSPLLTSRVLHQGGDAWPVGVLVIAVAAYGMHCVLAGAYSGASRWRDAAAVIAGEATLRLLATVAVVAVAASVSSMGAASACGAAAWLLLLGMSRTSRSALHLRADCRGPVLARRVTAALVAQGASAVLVVGFPILLAATTSRSEYASAAPFLLAISLTRAPVLLPLNALQGVAVSHLVRAGSGLGRLLLRLLALVAGVGVVAAAAAWVIGPFLLRSMFGPTYVVEGVVLAALTIAAAGTAALTLTGACAQALASHGWYLAGWLVAVATCVLLLQVEGTMEWRGCLALGVAPVAGLAVHVLGLARLRRAGRAAAAAGDGNG